jgi:hypothetical protein
MHAASSNVGNADGAINQPQRSSKLCLLSNLRQMFGEKEELNWQWNKTVLDLVRQPQELCCVHMASSICM